MQKVKKLALPTQTIANAKYKKRLSLPMQKTKETAPCHKNG